MGAGYEILLIAKTGGGLFVKAHEQPNRVKNKAPSSRDLSQSQESFVDDDVVLDFHNVPPDDHSKTQTLPKSYKTRVKNKEFESLMSSTTKVCVFLKDFVS